MQSSILKFILLSAGIPKKSKKTQRSVYIYWYLGPDLPGVSSTATPTRRASKTAARTPWNPQEFRNSASIMFRLVCLVENKTSENRRWVILATFFFQTCCFALKDARYWAAQQLRSDVECVGCTGIRQPNLYRQKKKLKRWRPAILWAVFLVLSIFNNLSWGARTKVKS